MHIGGFLCCGNRFKQLRILAHKVPDPHAGRRRFGEAAEQNAVVKPACGDVGQRFAVKAQLAVGIILNQDDIFVPNDIIHGFAVLGGVGKAGGILEVRHGIDEFHPRRRKRGGKALNIQTVLAECDGMERGRILQEGLERAEVAGLFHNDAVARVTLAMRSSACWEPVVMRISAAVTPRPYFSLQRAAMNSRSSGMPAVSEYWNSFVP